MTDLNVSGNGNFRVIGTRPLRHDGVDKVTGRAKYTADIALDGQLEGAILRSPHPHARVVTLDLGAVRKLPGVAAAISLLGPDRTVRFAGQEIAAVAAANWKTARAALDAIVVRYETLPAAIGMDEARRTDAPRVFSGFRKTLGNVSEGPMLPTRWSKNLRGPSGGLSDKPGKARKMLEAAKAAGDPLLGLRGHTEYVMTLAAIPDGQALALSSGDHTRRLWTRSP